MSGLSFCLACEYRRILAAQMAGILYLVSTPIGNLGDITLRAVETLRAADIIACEDTRHTQKLLNHLGIKAKLVSYHEHNEETRAGELIDQLVAGRSVAVVSDAGTPAINDPGFTIVRRAIEKNIEVVSLPGPSAVITALAAAGLPTDAFFFGGFLPAKSGERQRRLRELANVPATLVFYEAPHRLAVSLADCVAELGDRDAVVARELTKLHEQYSRGKLSELGREFSGSSVRGEIVLLIDRSRDENMASVKRSTVIERIAELESTGIDRKTALKQAAREFGISKSQAYRDLQNAKNS
jgi:16S rRNA (cytidine1402-2'-O)-methyltransferase